MSEEKHRGFCQILEEAIDAEASFKAESRREITNPTHYCEGCGKPMSAMLELHAYCYDCTPPF